MTFLMNVVNRTAAVIKPKAPYVQWANQVATSYESVESMQNTSHVFLLPYQAYSNADEFLKEHWQTLFYLELDSWTEDQGLWPKQIDFQLFTEWFDVESYALVIDFADEGLSSEPYV